MRRVCKGCSKTVSGFRKCRSCGMPVCYACVINGQCPECANPPEKNVNEYYEDKYMKTELEKIARIGAAFVLLLTAFALVSASVTAYEFSTVSLTQSVTDFEWCFTQPYDKSVVWDNTDVELYTDNFGCDITEQKLVRTREVPVTTEVCEQVKDCEDKPKAASLDSAAPECDVKVVCENTTEYKTEEVDLTTDNPLLSVDDVFCLRAKRKASTNNAMCDINMRTSDYDVRDYGFAWWNVTFNRKYEINVTEVSEAPYIPFRLDFSDTNINMSDCQADGGDVRFVNATEDGELVYNLSSWDGSTGVAYVNLSLNSQNRV